MSDKTLNQVRNKALLFETGYAYAKDLANDRDLDLTIKCPESIDAWFHDFADHLVKEEKRHKRQSKLRSLAKKVAIFFGGSIITLSILTLSVEAFRVELFNLFIDRQDQYDTLTFEQEVDADSIPAWTEGAYLSYLPEGYALKEAYNNVSFKTLVYTKFDESTIIFTQKLINESIRVKFDNETVNQELVDLNGNTGYMYSKNDYIKLSWIDDEYVFSLEGDLSLDEMIMLANSKKYLK